MWILQGFAQTVEYLSEKNISISKSQNFTSHHHYHLEFQVQSTEMEGSPHPQVWDRVSPQKMGLVGSISLDKRI